VFKVLSCAFISAWVLLSSFLLFPSISRATSISEVLRGGARSYKIGYTASAYTAVDTGSYSLGGIDRSTLRHLFGCGLLPSSSSSSSTVSSLRLKAFIVAYRARRGLSIKGPTINGEATTYAPGGRRKRGLEGYGARLNRLPSGSVRESGPRVRGVVGSLLLSSSRSRLASFYKLTYAVLFC
jgi:hypothetical protein